MAIGGGEGGGGGSNCPDDDSVKIDCGGCHTSMDEDMISKQQR
jgi:hypothetical protein